MSNEAIAKGETAHVGRIFDICVEKNSELPESDPNRKFKGRVVFEGCHVTVETLRASATSGNPPATPPKPLGGMTVAPRTPPLRKTNDPVHVDDTSPELFREIIVRRKKTAAVYPRHQQPSLRSPPARQRWKQARPLMHLGCCQDTKFRLPMVSLPTRQAKLGGPATWVR